MKQCLCFNVGFNVHVLLLLAGVKCQGRDQLLTRADNVRAYIGVTSPDTSNIVATFSLCLVLVVCVSGNIFQLMTGVHVGGKVIWRW